MLRVGETVFLREEHTKWLSNAKWFSPENTHKSSIKQTEHLIFSNKCPYMCKYMCNKNKEKRCHIFKREVHGGFWKEGREGKMM